MDVLEDLAEQVEWRMGQIEGFADVRSEAETGSDEIRLTVDHNRARNFGLTSNTCLLYTSPSPRD